MKQVTYNYKNWTLVLNGAILQVECRFSGNKMVREYDLPKEYHSVDCGDEYMHLTDRYGGTIYAIKMQGNSEFFIDDWADVDDSEFFSDDWADVDDPIPVGMHDFAEQYYEENEV